MAGDWWLVAGGWWLMAGDWWLVAGGWRVGGYALRFTRLRSKFKSKT